MSQTMSVSDALEKRISVRAYLNKEVTQDAVRAILETAKLSPSGGNVQPWRIDVVMGAKRDGLVDEVKARIQENPFAQENELAVYPEGLWEPFRTRRYTLGEQMYEKLGVPREDKVARLMWLQRNFEFFGAPAGLFFSLDRRFDKGQWAHLGMLMQSIALAATERGLGTCMQEAWQTRAKTVSEFLDLPDTQQLYCGMALGHADPDAPVNTLRSERAALDEFVTFHTD
ncbi:MAG: nitroreductase [Pseudomonadota bacterium]